MQCFLIIALYFMLTGLALADETAPQKAELRGCWLTNVDSEVMYQSDGIAEAMQFLADHHFNAVYPVVWNKAHTLYPSAVMDSIFGEIIDPRCVNRDPLQEIITEARKHQIKVIPWFEFGFAASYNLNGGYLLKMKPHWAAKDSAGNLLTKNGFEWLNAYHPEVQEFMISLVMEVVRNYDIDGVQGDDRLPAQPLEGGYSEYTDSLYRSQHNGEPPPQNYRDPNWQRWRGDQLNAFAQRLYSMVKAEKPNVVVSWSPSIFPWSFDEYLQDWPAWLNGGYADQIIPQFYRYDIEKYQIAIDGLADENISNSGGKIFAGVLMNVGQYIIDEEYLLSAIRYHRSQGLNGEVFFFYEGLRKNDDALARLLLETIYKEPASFPEIR